MNSKYIYTSFIKKSAGTEEFDIERFIIEVKKRECIWNVNSKSYNLKCYRNRETKKQAWEEIARIFNSNWEKFSPEDKQKKVDSLARKWANIRKYYTDEVRRPATESPPKKKPRRWYHHLLTFLDDSVNKRRIQRIKEFKNIAREKTGNDSSSDSESNELYIVEDANELAKMSHYNNGPYAPELKNNPTTITDPRSPENREGLKAWQMWDNPIDLAKSNAENKPVNTPVAVNNPEIMKLLNDAPRGPTADNAVLITASGRPVPNNVLSALNKTSSLDLNADACKKFLLSLLPEIMSLNVKQNMQFRLGILDLLNDIKFKVNYNIEATMK